MDLRTARLRKNMTQAELAQTVGVTVAMANFYESGKHLPRLAKRRRIEQILGPIDWLPRLANSQVTYDIVTSSCRGYYNLLTIKDPIDIKVIEDILKKHGAWLPNNDWLDEEETLWLKEQS